MILNFLTPLLPPLPESHLNPPTDHFTHTHTHTNTQCRYLLYTADLHLAIRIWEEISFHATGGRVWLFDRIVKLNYTPHPTAKLREIF